MRNPVITIGLSREEIHTLDVLLPLTFQVISCSADEVSEKEMDAFMTFARCIVLNPKKLENGILASFLTIYAEAAKQGCAPILLFSNAPTRMQMRYEIENRAYHRVDLHKRLDRTLRRAIKLLRASSMPSWKHTESMKSNMFNDGWYLIDIETSGLFPFRDDVIAVKIAYMSNYDVFEEETIFVKPSRPISQQTEDLTGITNEMLSHGEALESVVERLSHLEHPSPIVVWDEDFTISFLEAAFHLCGKVFDKPYVAIESLAARIVSGPTRSC